MYLVDLARPLLDIARARRSRPGWSHVTIVEADASATGLETGIADVVLCSYSLTMMPDWRATVAEARRLLAPGGALGVVDFHRPSSARGLAAPQALISHRVLPWWFRQSRVYLSRDHAAELARQFRAVSLVEAYGTLPYLPGVRAPYYRFIGAR